ncbi:hypothetical protein BGX27_001830 [Mortierella sp. AM989]|nr:hypothetical protein BGX27_001830 [Mortierella sp. AM989]
MNFYLHEHISDYDLDGELKLLRMLMNVFGLLDMLDLPRLIAFRTDMLFTTKSFSAILLMSLLNSSLITLIAMDSDYATGTWSTMFVKPTVPIADNAPLSTSWWHNITTAIESNNTAFQQYWIYRGKSANKIEACAAGSACQFEMICDLRTGKSSDSCTMISFFMKKHTDIRSDRQTKDLSGLRGLFKGDAKP